MTALAIWSGWCFALADRRVITRKGFLKAIEFFFAGLVRYPTWKLLLGIWIAGVIGISIVFKVDCQLCRGQVGWRHALVRIVLIVGRTGDWRRRDLGDPNRRVGLHASRSDGFRRRDINGDDRRVSGLARLLCSDSF